MSFDQEKYLITGAAGQLGYCLQDAWKGNDEEEGSAIARAKEALDITNKEHTLEWLPRLNPDVVVNCAAYTNVQGAEENRRECWRVNVKGVQNLVKACSENGIAMVHISSDFVFGQDWDRHVGRLKAIDPTRRKAPSREEQERTTCYQEEDAVGPVGFYGQTKALAEHVILQEALRNPDFDYYIIRTAGLFEKPWRNGKNFPYAITSRLLNSKVTALPVVSDVVTNITYVPHLVEAIRWIVENRNEITVDGVTIPTGVYHITNTGMASWFKIAQQLERSVGFTGKLQATTRQEFCEKSGRRPELNPAFTALCSNRYEETLGPPLPSWKEAISEWAKLAVKHF